MKNKKSKIIVPALGLILLSTAASISGSVAWFTANRTATVTAGEFAVIKTGDDLKVVLGAGVGTNDPGQGTSITTKTDYKLTDSSFNHASYSGTILPIITPDTARANVAATNGAVALASASEENLLRGAASGKTYSAFTWTIRFDIAFSASATKKQGLFLDLSDASKSYMHEVCKFTQGATVKAAEAGDYYKSHDFKEANKVTLTEGGTITAEQTTLYRAPDASGQAFRIAIVPTNVPANSYGYAKVWAANEDGTPAPTYVSATSGALGGTAYSNATVSLTSVSTYASAEAGTAQSPKVLMTSNDGVPANEAKSSTSALSDCANYLGYFNPNPGETVSMTFTCVAWYEGTHDQITQSTTDFELMTSGMQFAVTDLSD